jgi:hypothetical protein
MGIIFLHLSLICVVYVDILNRDKNSQYVLFFMYKCKNVVYFSPVYNKIKSIAQYTLETNRRLQRRWIYIFEYILIVPVYSKCWCEPLLWAIKSLRTTKVLEQQRIISKMLWTWSFVHICIVTQPRTSANIVCVSRICNIYAMLLLYIPVHIMYTVKDISSFFFVLTWIKTYHTFF